MKTFKIVLPQPGERASALERLARYHKQLSQGEWRGLLTPSADVTEAAPERSRGEWAGANVHAYNILDREQGDRKYAGAT